MSGTASGGAAAKRQRKQREEDEAAVPAALEIIPDFFPAFLLEQQQVHINRPGFPLPSHMQPYALTPLFLQSLACAAEAERLLAAGNYAAAAAQLQLAIDAGHSLSRALMAWLLIWGREGIAVDSDTAFDLVQEGARLGCHHCQGVLACFHFIGTKDLILLDDEREESRVSDLARASAQKGSRYGQYALGLLLSIRDGSIGPQTLSLWQKAADQGLDAAQMELGQSLYGNGIGEESDRPDALRLCKLAADQGFPRALFCVGLMHELGHHGFPADSVEALALYKRAAAAGHCRAVSCVRKFGAQACAAEAERLLAAGNYAAAAAQLQLAIDMGL